MKSESFRDLLRVIMETKLPCQLIMSNNAGAYGLYGFEQVLMPNKHLTIIALKQDYLIVEHPSTATDRVVFINIINIAEISHIICEQSTLNEMAGISNRSTVQIIEKVLNGRII